MQILVNLQHRGACGCEDNSGDGAGIMLQVPHKFLKAKCAELGIRLYKAGLVWPLLRTHSLLNNLQPVMGNTPLLLFYPGRYDGQSLRLFGKLKNNNYYRAFKLVP